MKKIIFFIFVIIGLQLMILSKPTTEKEQRFSIGEVKTIDSSIYHKKKSLQIFLPKNYRFTHEKYPVLFVLDGNVHFHYTTGIVKLIAGVEIPQVIVVGIPNRYRINDATPSKDPKYPKGGGAKQYIEFLKNEVIPFIDKNYRTEDYRILAGHSLDGLTTVYSFLYHYKLFNAYIANSPSLWWNDKKLMKEAGSANLFNSKKKKNIFFSYGDKDSPRLIEGVKLFKKLLTTKTKPLISWKNKIFENSGHGDSAIKGMYDGLKYIFEGYYFLNKARDFEKIKKHFSILCDKFGYDIKIPEMFVKQIGYQALLREKNPEKAIKIFKINVKNYPESADGHDCLGEAYEANRQLKNAKSEFELAVKFGKNKNNLKIYNEHLNRVNKKITKKK